MKRRNLLKALTVSSIVPSVFPEQVKGENMKAERKKKVLMQVGCQSGGTSIENLAFKARHGVFNIDGGAPKTITGKGWDLDDSLKKKEACEKYGIRLDAYHFPLTSQGFGRIHSCNCLCDMVINC